MAKTLYSQNFEIYVGKQPSGYIFVELVFVIKDAHRNITMDNW